MTATVEILDGLNRRLTLNVNQAAIEAEVSKRLNQVARTCAWMVSVPARRRRIWLPLAIPAKSATRCLAKRCNRNSAAAIQANNLHVAGYPQFAPAEGGGFNATFEVFPEIKLGDLSQIKVTRPVVEVADADVDRTLDVLRKQRVHLSRGGA
jgi:trigger factor